MSTPAPRVVLCIENSLYRQYVESEFAASQTPVISVEKGELAQAIAERPSGTLLLQSDREEWSLIELSTRLKRIFGDEIRVLLLSSDYRTAEVAASAVDAFLQFPVPFERIRETIRGLEDTTRRILIIDDSKLVHSHLVPPLRQQGYEVDEAFDGEEGLAKARDVKPDLIVCDIEMPRMNGFEVCRAIRRTPETADTYIIMSSTLGSAADQQKGFESGVDEYITKPVVVPELLDRIRKAFTAARAGRESILVVEDDEPVARSIAKSLTNQGFSTRVAGTIREAFKILRRIQYDLVISPITLQDGTMIDLFAAIRTLPQDRQPDVLIMASRDSQADEKMVMNAGAAGIISKPFTMDTLLAATERALADRRASLEKAQLEKYVSKASVRMAIEKSILSGRMATARAFRRSATIFFSDVAGFTTRCEKYSPREVVTQVNTLFDVMTRVIMESQGDIDKFIGDACMAFWLDEDPVASAERAVRATLRLRRELARMNQENGALVDDPIHIRVGINTGEIILCDLGAPDARIDLTIIGDPVNVAARFESAAKQYGVDNLIGESSIKPLLDRFSARLIDWVRVKGKNEPVECYELVNEQEKTSAAEEQLIREFGQAMLAYRTGNFEAALSLFEESQRLERGPTGGLTPSRLYQERCRKLIETPPRHWTGVWSLESK